MANPQPHYQPHYHDAHFSALALEHFNVVAKPWQRRVGSTFMGLSAASVSVRMLCVKGTGLGKSILYQTLAAHYKEVTLYISPLLTLGADQVQKLMDRTNTITTRFVPIFLDGIKSSAEAKEFAVLMKNVDPETVIILFASPQTLVNRHKAFFKSVIRLIRFVVVDEIHLFNAFGRSFRSEFTGLKTVLFQRLVNVPMLFLTATCTARIRDSFASMIGVAITHYDWPDEVLIRNRKVSLVCQYSSKPFSSMCRNASAVVRADRQSKIIVYSNARKRVIELKEKIGNFLDGEDDLSMMQVLAIHGHQSKVEKTGYIQMFLSGNDEDDGVGDDNDSSGMNFLCATSGVANVGIDSDKVRAVYRMDFPPSIIDFVQECGRAGRVAEPSPQTNFYTVYYSIESFIYLYERAMNPEEECLDKTYRIEEVQDALDIASLMVLQKECLYVEIERHLANPLTIGQVNHTVRCSYCPFCNNESKVVPSLNREGVTTVFVNIFNTPPSNVRGSSGGNTSISTVVLANAEVEDKEDQA